MAASGVARCFFAANLAGRFNAPAEAQGRFKICFFTLLAAGLLWEEAGFFKLRALLADLAGVLCQCKGSEAGLEIELYGCMPHFFPCKPLLVVNLRFLLNQFSRVIKGPHAICIKEMKPILRLHFLQDRTTCQKPSWYGDTHHTQRLAGTIPTCPCHGDTQVGSLCCTRSNHVWLEPAQHHGKEHALQGLRVGIRAAIKQLCPFDLVQEVRSGFDHLYLQNSLEGRHVLIDCHAARPPPANSARGPSNSPDLPELSNGSDHGIDPCMTQPAGRQLRPKAVIVEMFPRYRCKELFLPKEFAHACALCLFHELKCERWMQEWMISHTAPHFGSGTWKKHFRPAMLRACSPQGARTINEVYNYAALTPARHHARKDPLPPTHHHPKTEAAPDLNLPL